VNAPDLVVDSATGVDVELPVAGPGARSFAFLIDWHIRAILGIAWYVVAAILYNRDWNILAPLSADTSWFIYVVAPAAAVYFLYHPALEIATRGTTPGKRMVGVRIVTRRGAAPGVGALLTRNVFRLVDSFPVAYAVGIVVTILTRDHVRVGDLAAGTLLVYTPVHTPPPENMQERGHDGGPESGANRALRRSLLRRSPVWKLAAVRAQRLASGGTHDAGDAIQLASDYRMLAHDVSRARYLLPGTRTLEYLETAYARAHATLHRGAWHPGYALLRLFRDEIPEVVRWLRPHILWATALFILSALAGYWMVRTYPDLIGLFASPDLIASVERGQLWTEGLLNVVPSSVVSLQILTNNIVVSLLAYCAGTLFGLGTVYIVGLNGLMLGAVFAFTSLHGLGTDLLRFIVPHGCVEISVMCLSGAAGAAVGEALIRPITPHRAESFQLAARRSGRLLLACAVLLVGSGAIEGYVSANPEFTLQSRIVIGVVYWLFMVALLCGWLFGRRRARSP